MKYFPIFMSIVILAGCTQFDMEKKVDQESFQAGYQEAVADLIKQAETCEVFPIFLGEVFMELQKTDCEGEES